METLLDASHLTPPFRSGDLIRPLKPRHPWRAHRICVKACHHNSNQGWLLVVRIYMGNVFTATVMADDFEKASANR